MVVKQWHHTCCHRHTQCWRDTEEEAVQHMQERADHLRIGQTVRYSQRMKKWVIENLDVTKPLLGVPTCG